MLYKIVRLMALLFFGFFSKLRIEGNDQLPSNEAFILAPNHFSNLDVFILLAAAKREFYTLGKIEVFRNPILKWFAINLKIIPVNRTGFCRNTFMAATEILQQNKIITVFPEGTVCKDGKMGHFKHGIAKLALEAKVPIVPVAIIGSNRVLPLGRKIPRPHWVIVKFGKPIYLKNYEQDYDRKIMKDITEKLRNEVMALINSKKKL